MTLSTLPSAHAVLFVLAADAGVTRSDLEMWQHHIKGFQSGRQQGLMVVLNKIDRADARPAQVLDEVYDLFIDLDATDAQLDFPVFCTDARKGLCRRGIEGELGDLRPLLDQILEALPMAIEGGLRIPLVYNTGGYDSREALALLDGIVDIYMPDMKYGDSQKAQQFSHARDYVAVNRSAVKEMHRQVGDLDIDQHGIAQRGLLVRHLVLPGNASGTDAVLDFLATEVSPDTYVNVMDQYRPCYRADEHPPRDRICR